MRCAHACHANPIVSRRAKKAASSPLLTGTLNRRGSVFGADSDYRVGCIGRGHGKIQAGAYICAERKGQSCLSGCQRFPVCQPEPFAELFRCSGLDDVITLLIEASMAFKNFAILLGDKCQATARLSLRTRVWLFWWQTAVSL